MRWGLGAVLLVVAVAASGCVFVRTSPDEVVTTTFEPRPAPPEPHATPASSPGGAGRDPDGRR